MKTILVIEDQPQVRENLSEILELARYNVLAAADGKQGVELCRAVLPDLILCDIVMPQLDGYGVLHLLSKDPATASIPFIFLTARIEPAHVRSGMNLGADDYLTKPVDDVTLLNAVEMRLKKSQLSSHPASMTGLPTLLAAVASPPEAGQSLDSAYPSLHYQKKQWLFAEGSTPSGLYFIRRGQFKGFTSDALGNALITSLMGAGDFVGYSAMVARTPYSESVEALTDADVCMIPKGEFLALLAQHPDVAAYFMGLLARELTQDQGRLLKLAYQSVRKRVAEALLLVYRKFYSADYTADLQEASPGSRGSSGPLSAEIVGKGSISQQAVAVAPPTNQSPPMALSRESWAQLVGASTETVIRALSDLRQEGLIELMGSQITILDLDRLARLKH